MDFLNGKIRPMYFKYLSAAFGSVIFSMKRGNNQNDGSENQYFTAALILCSYGHPQIHKGTVLTCRIVLLAKKH